MLQFENLLEFLKQYGFLALTIVFYLVLVSVGVYTLYLLGSTIHEHMSFKREDEELMTEHEEKLKGKFKPCEECGSKTKHRKGCSHYRESIRKKKSS